MTVAGRWRAAPTPRNWNRGELLLLQPHSRLFESRDWIFLNITESLYAFSCSHTSLFSGAAKITHTHIGSDVWQTQAGTWESAFLYFSFEFAIEREKKIKQELRRFQGMSAKRNAGLCVREKQAGCCSTQPLPPPYYFILNQTKYHKYS